MTTQLAEADTPCEAPARLSDVRGKGLGDPLREVETRLARAEVWVDVLTSICRAEDMQTAARRAASELQRRLGGTRVAIGITRGLRGNVRLLALSDVQHFSQRSDMVRKIEAALDEVIWQRELIVWPSADHCDEGVHHAHRQLSNALGGSSLMSLPLPGEPGACGLAILWIDVDRDAELGAIQEFAAGAAVPLGAALQLARRAETWRLAHIARKAFGPGARRRICIGLAVSAAVLAVLGFPLPYRIACQCEVQPVARRFLVAPFDGSLEETFVSPGDRVAAGQVLAMLDGRDIRCELASNEAEYQRVAKEYDTALANGFTAAAQIARLEMQRLELKSQLLKRRQQELEIRSPIAGILISGDWHRARGAKLTIGQTLFEIGPLDQMLVEVAVPEEDVCHARSGAPVDVQINALAPRNWSGRLERIHPRAEIRDDENVFIAEVVLPNPQNELLPGMKGTAKVRGPTRPLGWNLFHKPWNVLRKWLGV
jgi:hypothetical protein